MMIMTRTALLLDIGRPLVLVERKAWIGYILERQLWQKVTSKFYTIIIYAKHLFLGKGTRRTLLVINEDFKARGKESISVKKNEVVFLIHGKIQGWFFVKNKEGQAGYIPSVIAGHGFL